MEKADRMKTQTSEDPSAIKSTRFRLHALQEVLALPPPDWLITDVLPVGSQGVLFGSSGSGKSFVALDMALSIATGQPWQDLKVRRGSVAYIVAEGGHSIGKRADAWIQHRGLAPIDDMFFVLEPVQLRNPDHINGLVRQIDARDKQPVLIVFDTLARCFVDGEENSAKDVGVVVHHAALLQRHTGACVLILHHTGRAAQNQERGSTALRGAADVMICQTKDEGIITLRNTKQKDADEFAPMTLELRQFELEMSPAASAGRVTSCVVVQAEARADGGEAALNAGQRTLLTVLLGRNGDGTTGREWRTAVATETGNPVATRTFQNWRQALVQAGLVEAVPGTAPPRYRLTEDGHVRATGMPA